MSEQSQGPGWWKASDGKWYPPEQAPPSTPPATQPISSQPTVYPGAPSSGPPPSGPPGGPPAGPPGGPPAGPPTGPSAPPPPGPPGGAAASNTPKIVAVVVALALIGGGAAFALTRGGGSSGSTKSFCDTAKKFQNDDSLNKAFNDPAQVDKAIAAFDQLVKASPSQIKGDMQTLQEALNKIGSAVKAAGNEPDKQFAAVLAAAAGLDQKKLDQAGKNVDNFGKQNCGPDFSFSNSSTSDTDSALSSSFGTAGSFSFDTNSSYSFDSSSYSSVISEASSFLGSDFFSDFSTSS